MSMYFIFHNIYMFFACMVYHYFSKSDMIRGYLLRLFGFWDPSSEVGRHDGDHKMLRTQGAERLGIATCNPGDGCGW